MNAAYVEKTYALVSSSSHLLSTTEFSLTSLHTVCTFPPLLAASLSHLLSGAVIPMSTLHRCSISCSVALFLTWHFEKEVSKIPHLEEPLNTDIYQLTQVHSHPCTEILGDLAR